MMENSGEIIKRKKQPVRQNPNPLWWFVFGIPILICWIISVIVQYTAPNYGNSPILFYSSVLLSPLICGVVWHWILPRMDTENRSDFAYTGSLIHGVANVIIGYIAFGGAFGPIASVCCGIIGVVMGATVGNKIYASGQIGRSMGASLSCNLFLPHGLVFSGLVLMPILSLMDVEVPREPGFTFTYIVAGIGGGLVGILLASHYFVRPIALPGKDEFKVVRVTGFVSGFAIVAGGAICAIIGSINSLLSVIAGIMVGVLIWKYRIHQLNYAVSVKQKTKRG